MLRRVATHRIHHVNGIRLHTVEEGEGPLVLLIHGFPESWYSWRRQLPVLADAGYRAVAIDVRGYGRSSKPETIEEYRMLCLVADNVALVEALGETQAVIVGHDWGAPIAWSSALLRPDMFRAVAGLSVPYSPPSATRPSDAFRAMGGDEEFYIEYFQQPGRAEAEIEADVRTWLLGFYFTASGDAARPGTRTDDGDDPARRPDARPLPLSGRDAGVADRGGPRLLRRRVRAHRVHGRAQPLPQHRPRLRGALGLQAPPDRGAGPVHRRRPRRADDLGPPGHRPLRHYAAARCTAR